MMMDGVQRVDVPSANVQSLQRRAAGVLPIRMDVPRAARRTDSSNLS